MNTCNIHQTGLTLRVSLQVKIDTNQILTWSRYWLLACLGLNILYHFSKGSERHREYMTGICSDFLQLRFPVSSTNSKHKDLTASRAKMTRRCSYRVRGFAIGEHNKHSFPTTCGSSWIKISSGKRQCLADVGSPTRIPQIVDSSQDGRSGVISFEAEDGYGSASVENDTNVGFSARDWEKANE